MKSELEQLAEAIHGIHCHWNHTDGCDWYYDEWPAQRKNGARLQYLVYAEKLERLVEHQQIVTPLELLTYLARVFNEI